MKFGQAKVNNDNDSSNKTEQEQLTHLKKCKRKKENEKKKPFVKRKLCQWPGSSPRLPRQTLLCLWSWCEENNLMAGHCQREVSAFPSLSSPTQLLEGIENATGRASTSTKQLYLDHGKLSRASFLLFHPPICLPPGPKCKRSTRPTARHLPERNPVGWGLQASHHWGECCQARGLGQLLHSVETQGRG